MCILFIYTNPIPKRGSYRLIIASNRDEYYCRPAKSVFLCTESNVIGGRDMEKGREDGMWLGVSTKKTDAYKFRFGALLNVTGEERKQGVVGRGPIVANYLRDEIPAKEYVRNLQKNAQNFNAFNFVAVELSEEGVAVFHQSNVPNACSSYEGEQILGFGNSTVATPLSKVSDGKEKFAWIISTRNRSDMKTELVDELLNLLKWDVRHLPDEELKRRAPKAFEFLSCVFVKLAAAGYGTRTHSIVLVDYDWNLEFIEQTMEEPIDPNNPIWLVESIKARL